MLARRGFFVEDFVDRLRYRHFDAVAGVDVADAVGREVAFRHHRHFVQRAFHRAAVADEQAQTAVAAVYRVARHQQVAYIGRYQRVAGVRVAFV